MDQAGKVNQDRSQRFAVYGPGGVRDDAAGLPVSERCRYKLTNTHAQGLALVSKKSRC